ncbi:MAG: Spy/CpxP family protein refolding chaperone [Bryobacteraceae bacterium]
MNSINHTLLQLSAVAILASGLAFAQGPGPGGPGGGMMHTRFLSNYLSLTESQQTQLNTILQSERAAAKPAMETLKQQRQAVEQAIQAGQPQAQVSELANAEGAALGQLAALRAASQAQIHAMLTPDQQQKLATMQTRHHRGGPQMAAPTQDQ